MRISRLSLSGAMLIGALGATAFAAPLTVVNVNAPAVNCLFASSCKVTATDTLGIYPPKPGYTGKARLQSRTFVGKPGHEVLWRSAPRSSPEGPVDNLSAIESPPDQDRLQQETRAVIPPARWQAWDLDAFDRMLHVGRDVARIRHPVRDDRKKCIRPSQVEDTSGDVEDRHRIPHRSANA
jgi:hypothetical protein